MNNGQNHQLVNPERDNNMRAAFEAMEDSQRARSGEPVQWTTWVSGGIPCFTIGNQSFKLDYDNSDGTAEWMRSMLEKALSRLAAQVSASVPSTHVLVPRILPVEMLRAVDGTHEDKYVARGRVVEIWDLLLSALPGGQQGEKS